MILPLLAMLLLPTPYVDLSVRIDLPIPICVPELIGMNGTMPLTFPLAPLVIHEGDEPARIIIASTCRTPRWICLDWSVTCNSPCVTALGGRTATKSEIGEDAILLSVPEHCWMVVAEVVCRVEYHASAMGDLDANCLTTPNDVRILAGLKNRNRLEVFQHIQNEWWVGTPSE